MKLKEKRFFTVMDAEYVDVEEEIKLFIVISVKLV